ncbi:MAG: hypothetical protein LBR72_06220 [Oscillospiraceae bacterium]|jgi:hypothetical protein|nr:hypothetical protein [Oscillospiraceae bacterium]
MIQKKAVIGAAAFFLVASLFVGYFAIAAEVGGKENPLVTLDYLESLTPKIEELIELKVSERAGAALTEIDGKLELAKQTIDQMAQQGGVPGSVDASALLNDEAFIASIVDAITARVGGTTGTGLASASSRVEIEPGKSVAIPQGTNIMLRLGTGTVVASNSPGLIDMSDPGNPINDGQALLQDHLYTCTMEAGRDVKNTGTNTVTVFIWGPFTLK